MCAYGDFGTIAPAGERSGGLSKSGAEGEPSVEEELGAEGESDAEGVDAEGADFKEEGVAGVGNESTDLYIRCSVPAPPGQDSQPTEIWRCVTCTVTE